MDIGIELPPEYIDSFGRALLPDPENPVVIDAFDFTSVYRTFDGRGVSFVAGGDINKGQPEKQRLCMAVPDFITLLLGEEGGLSKALTEEERECFNVLGFHLDEIEIAEQDAVSFIGMREGRK